ncbi:MAG: hypothetical protein MZV65_34235 [Chromatiales bacterium]|nr:hypothetical protein [Chromatiales bacterium]
MPRGARRRRDSPARAPRPGGDRGIATRASTTVRRGRHAAALARAARPRATASSCSARSTPVGPALTRSNPPRAILPAAEAHRCARTDRPSQMRVMAERKRADDEFDLRHRDRRRGDSGCARGDLPADGARTSADRDR